MIIPIIKGKSIKIKTNKCAKIASLIILVKSNAWLAKLIVENENGTENKLKNIYCTSK